MLNTNLDFQFTKFVVKKKNLSEMFLSINNFVLFYIRYKNFINFFFKVSFSLSIAFLNNLTVVEKMFEGLNFCDITSEKLSTDFVLKRFSAEIYNWLNAYNIAETNIAFCTLKCITHRTVIPFLEDYFLVLNVKAEFTTLSLKVNELFFDDLLGEIQRYSDFVFFTIKKKNYLVLKNNFLMYNLKLTQLEKAQNLKLLKLHKKVKDFSFLARFFK